MNIAKKTAYLALLSAAALLFSYIETLFPPILPFYGFKLGIANIVTLFSLYTLDLKSTIIITAVRCMIMAALFTGPWGLAFSAAGSAMAILTMYGLLKSGRFSLFGISVAGATMHNIGQLLVAMLLVGSASVVTYLPFLMVCSAVTGLLIAAAAVLIIKRTPFKLKGLPHNV